MKKRDPRTFRPFVKLAADGSIAAVVHVAEGATPSDGAGSLYLDVSAFGRVDVDTHVGVQAAIATAVAEDKAKKTPPPPPPPKNDPPINTTRVLGGAIDLG